jgi:chlorophyll/bacteriochlorophyll a synthase
MAVCRGFSFTGTSRTMIRSLKMKMTRSANQQSFFPFDMNQRLDTSLYAKSKNADEKVSKGEQSARQLMGIKGASGETEKWKIRLQLCKPVTWIPLIWGVACGAAASGNYHTWNPFGEQTVESSVYITDALKAFTCMLLSGPILTGYTQTINDWEDREIDAINEPYRPIPSGAISEDEVLQQIWGLWALGLGLSTILDLWAGHTDFEILKLTLFGTFIAYIYSAPPLKLKANGWQGSFALGSSYISLPWLCGQAMFGELSWPVTILTIFYSIAGLGNYHSTLIHPTLSYPILPYPVQSVVRILLHYTNLHILQYPRYCNC